VTAGAVAARLALVAAAWSAVELARRGPSHRPVAAALCLALALDVLRLACRELGAPAEVLRAIYLGAPCASAWLALAVLSRVPRTGLWLCAGAWAGLAAQLCAGAWTDRAAFAVVAGWVAVCSVAAQVGCAGWYLRRPRVPTAVETCALVLLAGDLAGLVAAWRFPEPWRAWELNRWQLAVTLSVVGCVQWRRTRWTRTLAATSAPGSWPWVRS
jgi:hypothetical protein